jgi:LPS-assembly lipoprotein
VALNGRTVKRLTLIPHPSSLILLVTALLLAGCGFQLRGTISLPYESIFVQASPGSYLGTQLERSIAARGGTRIAENAPSAEAVLQILGERQERDILSLSGGGRVSEFMLRYRVAFRVTAGKGAGEYIPQNEIVLQRSISYSDQEASAKQSEEALLYRDMQIDAADQIMRRLQAAKPPGKA